MFLVIFAHLPDKISKGSKHVCENMEANSKCSIYPHGTFNSSPNGTLPRSTAATPKPTSSDRKLITERVCIPACLLSNNNPIIIITGFIEQQLQMTHELCANDALIFRPTINLLHLAEVSCR